MTTYTNVFSEIVLSEDKDGELAITFPPEVFEDIGWHPGDIIEFRVNDDGSFQMINTSK